MTRQRSWQLKHKRAGLCLRCSKKAIAGSQLCRKHRELQREAQRRWRAGKPPKRKGPGVKSRKSKRAKKHHDDENDTRELHDGRPDPRQRSLLEVLRG